MAKYNQELAEKITSLIAEELCSISDICKATGISRNTFYKWKRENPGFDKEIEDAMSYRNEILLSMAYSSIKQRLGRYTLIEEKDIYTPDETNPEEMIFKSKTVHKKEYLPDLRTIKMILDRADKSIKDKACKRESEIKDIEIKEPQVATHTATIPAGEETDNIQGLQPATISENSISQKKKNNVENMKKNIKIPGSCKLQRNTRHRKQFLKAG
ncbi:helix-turn-helix domain-containing protein [Dysgonomonas termitidis]|uniref:Helix-turn-helix domain-containing protein n=1 Tax=Dysgonomonas termitidis TaxID=1516126 RepID=A0ABV9KXK3_9BACT